MTNPFYALIVKNNPQGGSLVQWDLMPGFCDGGPYTYIVEWAETVTGDWTEVPGSPVVDTTFIMDPTQRMWSRELESYYRITLTTADGVYISNPVKAGQFWNKQDWLYARYICKAELLLMKKFTGWSGKLLKRRIWGPECPDCLDYGTEEVANPKCTTCYGTGLTGGYWEAFSTYVYNVQAGPTRNKQFDNNLGISEPIRIQSIRLLGYPHVSSYDVFVNDADGTRWIIRPTAVAAEVKSVPIVYSAELRLAPFTDIVYQVPFVPNVPVPDPTPSYTDGDSDSEVIVITAPDRSIPEEEQESPIEEPSSEDSSEEETEFVIPLTEYALWWESGSWWVGTTIGAEETALYRTTDGSPIPELMGTFSWTTVDGYEPAPSATYSSPTVTLSGAGEAGVNGDYVRSGTYEGMYVYRQET